MEILFWSVVFVISAGALVKGADWLLQSSEKMGLAMGLSPFVVGVIIVSLGTSFPELITAFFASFQGISEFAAANAIGSNLANILLVVGFSAVLAKKISVTKNIIDVELPLLAIGTTIFLAVAWNGNITTVEAIIMVLVYGIYLAYTVLNEDEEVSENDVFLPIRVERRGLKTVSRKKSEESERPLITKNDILFFVLSVVLLTIGSKYLIDSVVALSVALQISVGVITITAVAIGTSLPELLVSVKAALQKKPEVALGNVFGSNAFNMMIVVGLPAIFFNVNLDEQTLLIGLPALGVVTLLFIISGISRKIHFWEGAFYLALYVIFLFKLFGLS